MTKTNHTLLVIAGPTAIGKTSLSITLARHYSCPIISADSRQFFKELSIGTAKPSIDEMQGVRHYFIDSHAISDNYNVGKFEKDALELLEELFKNHELVIMVGGSGLYIDAVCNGFDELPEADPAVRSKINALMETEGITGLQQLLQKLDPVYYDQVDKQNPQRLSRALEVCLISGKRYSDFRKETAKKRNFNIIKIGLTAPREVLYQRINDRVDQMMKDGLLAEVKRVENHKHLNALQTVGYKELFDYLSAVNASIDHPETHLKLLAKAVELIKQNTRRFAKRQLTWFRRDEQMKWFDPTETTSILTYIEENRIRKA
ncbi:MAG TPA: tRNA (adenosine(37)-N6)-dimethylallyltransferase MiaA [Bacteroidia bacterium]|nr:tRNA (adenosine(37)-N6)-dimethylallyltransferase MiaA [Bacteroidia bacterium]